MIEQHIIFWTGTGCDVVTQDEFSHGRYFAVFDNEDAVEARKKELFKMGAANVTIMTGIRSA